VSSGTGGHEGALWARASAGDGEALGTIFDLHQHRVYRQALWMLGNSHDAEDATATVFLELWRKHRDVRQVDGSVLPWLLTTTAYVCRNVRRSTRRYRSLLAALPRSDSDPSAEDEAFDRADVFDGIDPAFAQQLRDLPRGTLGLLILTAVEGYSVTEAAQAVGVSVGAAKTRLSRARVALRKTELSHDYSRQTAGGTP
jgi:RNA polymerase sigma factor (sigma-70 family)